MPIMKSGDVFFDAETAGRPDRACSHLRRVAAAA
jgi:hypothetical protein